MDLSEYLIKDQKETNCYLAFLLIMSPILQLLFSIGHKIGKIEGILLMIIYLYFALATLGLLPKP